MEREEMQGLYSLEGSAPFLPCFHVRNSKIVLALQPLVIKALSAFVVHSVDSGSLLDLIPLRTLTLTLPAVILRKTNHIFILAG